MRNAEKGFAFLIASRRPETAEAGDAGGISWRGNSCTAPVAEVIPLAADASSPLPPSVDIRPPLPKNNILEGIFGSGRNFRLDTFPSCQYM